MAAILNSTKEQIESILEKNGLFNIDLANYNTPSQIVISGDIDEIAKAQDYFQFEQVLYYPLNTSGAFHSRFMKPAKDEFKQYLEEFTFSDPKIPVLSNVTGLPYESGKIVDNLSEQLCNGVRWWDSMVHIMSQVDDRSTISFEEVGYGEVLTKMIGNIQKETTHLFEADSVEESKVVDTSNSDIEQQINEWNKTYPTGSKMTSNTLDYGMLITRSEAVILFGHRGAVYMDGYKGYFDINELTPA